MKEERMARRKTLIHEFTEMTEKEKKNERNNPFFRQCQNER